MLFKRRFTTKRFEINFPSAIPLAGDSSLIDEGLPVVVGAESTYPFDPSLSLQFVEFGHWKDPESAFDLRRYPGGSIPFTTVPGSDRGATNEKFWRRVEWFAPKVEGYLGPSFVWVMSYALANGNGLNSMMFDGNSLFKVDGEPLTAKTAIVDTSGAARKIKMNDKLPVPGAPEPFVFDSVFAFSFAHTLRESEILVPKNSTGVVLACYRDPSTSSGFVKYDGA